MPKVANTLKRRSLRARLADRARDFVEAILSQSLKYGLMSAVVVLVVLFFVGLSILAPSSPGRQVGFSDISDYITTTGAVQQATLLDQDHRIEITTTVGHDRFWTSYPADDAYTNQILDNLVANHIPFTVDAQSGKPTLKLVVQFLLPILILMARC